MVIINAHIEPIDRPLLEDGYVSIQDGVIAAVGDMPYDGGDNDVIDAQGAWLLPGFVDAHSHVGMWEDGLGFEGDDGNEDSEPATPQMRAVDAVNPFDRSFSEALASGVTTVVTGPGSSNPIGGQLCAMKTYGRGVDEMLVKAPVAMKMALGENPKTTFHGKNQAPVTRMATAAIIREQLAAAERYWHDKLKAAGDLEIDEPEYDAKYEALIPVIGGELPVHFHAHRLDDIMTAARIADEFDLQYVIIHGTQAHRAADLVADKGVPVLCGPLICSRPKPELRDLDPAGPAILSAEGVKIAIISDHPELPVQYLNICAGLAVREGLPYEEALRAITLYPAEICGIDGRVGSITPGKDADLILFRDDPLTLSAKPAMVIAGGRVAYREGDA